MSYRMAALANRLACHFGGGGGVTTTSPEIPPELVPLIRETTNRMIGLQDYFWGNSGATGYTPTGPNDDSWGYQGGPGPVGMDEPYNLGDLPNTQPPGGYPGGDIGWPGNQPLPDDQMPPADGGGGTVPQTKPPPADGGGGTVPQTKPSPTDGGTGGDTSDRDDPNWTPWSQAGPVGTEQPGTQVIPKMGVSGPQGITTYGDAMAPIGNAVVDPGFEGNMEAIAKASSFTPMPKLPMNQNPDGSYDPGGYIPGSTGYYGATTPDFTDETGMGIQGQNVRDVAGAAQGQRYAGALLPGLERRTAGETAAGQAFTDAFGNVGKRVTGESVYNDPAIAAAAETFNLFERPLIDDAASAAGYGRSLQKGDKQSLGLASMLLPQITASQQREERGIDRDIATSMGVGDAFRGLGGMETARRQGAIQTAMGVGDVQRQIEQERRDAPYEDFIRRASLGENMLTGPFGGLAPSTIGSQVTSSGGK